MQRFGSGLNLNSPLHMIALPGVFTVDKAKFHPLKAPNKTALRTLLNRVIQRLVRSFEKEGLFLPDTEQLWLHLGFCRPLASLCATPILYRIEIGPHSRSLKRTSHAPSFIQTDNHEKTLTAGRDGFSFNFAVACRPYQRDRLERLCSDIRR